MNGPDRRAARGRMPGGLLGTLVLIALVELFVARHALDFTAPEGWDWWMSRRAAGREAPRCGVLCFGDSLAKLGLVPRLLEERLGRPAYNHAVFAGQAPGSYFLLRRALGAGARPAAVVVDFHPHLLAAPYRDTARCWPELLGPRDALEMAAVARDPGFFAATLLARALPSLKDRLVLRAHVAGALRGEFVSSRANMGPVWRNQNRNRGAQVVPRNPAFRGDVDPNDGTIFPRAWAPHPVNAAFAGRFFALAGAHAIPVFWLIPPIAPAAQALRERRGLDGLYAEFARDLASKHPNVTVIDGRRAGYDHSLFIDPMHIDRLGAAALSAGVAEVLARHLADPGSSAPRWVALPPYREPAVDPPLEDIGQSRLALRRPGDGGGRR